MQQILEEESSELFKDIRVMKRSLTEMIEETQLYRN